FQALIPSYLRSELAPARALLVEDHTGSCIPCRRALREARQGRGKTTSHALPPVVATPSRRRSRVVWMSVAAMVFLAVLAGAVAILQTILAVGDRMARVESVQGNLFRLVGATTQPL